jgi:hypothetical protein
MMLPGCIFDERVFEAAPCQGDRPGIRVCHNFATFAVKSIQPHGSQ